MIKYIRFKNLNDKVKKNKYFIPIGEKTYIFQVNWSDECDCAFLSIYDDNNKPIILSRALVNKLIIRNYNLPYTFYYFQRDGETYEPTIDNISVEYVLAFDNEE